jgi:predicted phosphodiesterase
MSDLHLERIKYQFEITKAAPILVLAGDIGRFCDQQSYRSFLVKQCEQFEMVLLVAGNHEFYGSSREEGLCIAQSFVDDSAMGGKLHFLNRTRIDLPGSNTTILACTLQSHIAPDYTKLTNDFQRIQNWSVQDHNDEHKRDLAWLESTITQMSRDRIGRKIIIITHYAPAFEDTCHPLHTNNAVSQCFSSHALRQMTTWQGAQQVTHWVFGHTHWNTKFKSKGVTVVSNQYCNDSGKLTWWQKRTLYRPFNMKSILRV